MDVMNRLGPVHVLLPAGEAWLVDRFAERTPSHRPTPERLGVTAFGRAGAEPWPEGLSRFTAVRDGTARSLATRTARRRARSAARLEGLRTVCVAKRWPGPGGRVAPSEAPLMRACQ